jgi:DNA-binding transcriptional ArsR family regulator
LTLRALLADKRMSGATKHIRLAERPQTVGELADQPPGQQAGRSQHLKVLKDSGLVSERHAGTRRTCQHDPVGLGGLLDQLDMFWNRALVGYKEVVEHPTNKDS